ncbi:Glutathione-dependent formaldehyde-activating, GFA [Salmonella enterica subsp. enterica]|uniref:Glutathione-dependent formaldehyde-activating, GFA n=1 Tax=Salmonella enterica I TaxID=59201 RepID=A0A447PC52_SALET|nr:Glutathione-dependent formaldehyde-activating, GFA [Salmonella enterica subsp. enterica]
MQTFTGRCLCGQSHFTVDVEMLDVYACHCTLCQKWSGGIAMYLEACGQPQLDPLSPEPPYFSSSSRGERYFCSGCGCPLWFRLTRYRSLFYSLDLTGTERS